VDIRVPILNEVEETYSIHTSSAGGKARNSSSVTGFSSSRQAASLGRWLSIIRLGATLNQNQILSSRTNWPPFTELAPPDFFSFPTFFQFKQKNGTIENFIWKIERKTVPFLYKWRTNCPAEVTISAQSVPVCT
jgi:hypothetical protein